MRSVITILILGVLALIAALHFGLIDISQSRPATLPTVQTENGKVTARAGQTPEFDVATGSVEVTEKNATVGVPKVTVQAQPKDVKVPTVELKRAQPTDNSSAGKY